MAENPYSYGLPSVEPTAQPPSDYQRIQATPESFGAEIARGTEQFGKGFGQASAAGFDYLKHWGQVQTDGVLNDSMTAANDALEKYKALRGADALGGQDAINENIKRIGEEARKKLTTLNQQHQFDAAWRPFAERYIRGQINSHAVGQAYEHEWHTHEATQKTNLGIVPSAAGDKEAVLNLIGDAATARENQIRTQYGESVDPKLILEGRREVVEEGYKRWINTVAERDPKRAAQMAEEYKIELGKNYTSVAEHVKNGSQRQIGIERAQQRLGIGTGGLTVGTPGETPSHFANVRFNNPGAQVYSAQSAEFGGTPAQTGTGHSIAQFPTPVHGAAANFNLFLRKYTGRPLDDALRTWSGGGRGAPPGYDPNQIVTPEMFRNPDYAIPLMKALVGGEGPGRYPMDDAQWEQAHRWGTQGVTPTVKQLNTRAYASAEEPQYASVEDVEESEAKIKTDLMNDPYLSAPENETALRSALQEATRHFQVKKGAFIEQQRQRRLNEQAIKDQSEEEGTKIWQRLQSNQPIDIQKEIVFNPKLTQPKREHLLGIANQLTKPEPLPALSHRTTVDLLDRMRLPDGDPRKISDVNQITDVYLKKDGGTGLTTSDYDWLIKKVKDFNTLDGKNLITLEKKFIDSAHEILNVISATDKGAFTKYEFEQYIDRKIQDYRDQKKNPINLFDSLSPDYLGKRDETGHPIILQPFLKGMQQQSREQVKTKQSPSDIASERARLDEWVRQKGLSPISPANAAPTPPTSQ